MGNVTAANSVAFSNDTTIQPLHGDSLRSSQWTAFLAPPADLLDRVNVTITLALASVTFLYVVDDSLPKVSYLTGEKGGEPSET